MDIQLRLKDGTYCSYRDADYDIVGDCILIHYTTDNFKTKRDVIYPLSNIDHLTTRES